MDEHTNKINGKGACGGLCACPCARDSKNNEVQKETETQGNCRCTSDHIPCAHAGDDEVDALTELCKPNGAYDVCT